MPNCVFVPNKANTSSISASTTSGRVALQGTGKAVRIYNAGLVPVFIQMGNSSVAATTSNVPIAAGAVEVFGLNNNITHIAAIVASSTSAVYLTRGEAI